MRHIPLFICMLISFSVLNAQNVGIGTQAPDNSSILDLTSTSQGILIPRMTYAKRIIIPSPAQGLMVYQTDIDTGFYFFKGTIWINLTNNNSNTVSSTGLIFYTKRYPSPDGIWKANIDGTNQQQIIINLPSGFTLSVNNDGGQIILTSDKQKIIFKGENSLTNTVSLFSCNVDGTNVLKLIDNVGTSFDAN